MVLDFDKLHIDLSMDKVLADYPAHCLPTKLNKRSRKTKKVAFEKLDLSLYQADARMVAFYTRVDRLLAWIKAFDILYYDNLGQQESFNVNWFDDPPNWTEAGSSSNTIVIEFSSSDTELLNPLQYKITFYITTGTIQVQGNCKDIFVSEHFPILIRLVEMLTTKAGIKSACDLDSDSDSDDNVTQTNTEQTHTTDDEITYVKTLHGSEEKSVEQHPVSEVQDVSNATMYMLKTHEEHQMSNRNINTTIITEPICKTKTKDVSTSQELGEKFDTCISRMEGSFVKAIQDLSKTQSEIFEKAMKSIRDEISTSVTKQLRPVIREEVKILKDEIHSEIMSLKDTLKDSKSISFSNAEKSLREKITVMKSSHENEVDKLKQSYHERFDSQADKHRSKLESLTENHESQVRSLQHKFRSDMNTAQEQHETEIKKLKHKMEEYEEEIISLKLHASRTSELQTNAPGVQTVGSSHINAASSVSQTSHDDTDNNTDGASNIRQTKPFVLIIGTSNIKKIKEDKLSLAVNVEKHIAYTIPETLQKVRNVHCDHPPTEVLFHSFTNDIKSKSPEECIGAFTEVIDAAQSRWRGVKIIISLETARADNPRHNTNVKLLNALIEQKFFGSNNIHLCDNSNFFFNGEPIANFLADDQYHLTDKGASRLAANMRSAIHTTLGLQHNDRQYNNRAKKSGSRGFDNSQGINFPFPFFPPGYLFNRRGNGRGRGRGRRF